MRILVIGSGAREHSLAWKLAQSPLAETVFIAPGNGGTDEAGQNADIAADDIEGLVDFAKREKIDLVVPGPELPLTLGITDSMEAAGIHCFGPDSYCARLEGSKSFAKSIMAKANVPTGQAKVFTEARAAKEHVAAGPEKCVIKADGLAAGKGVIVAQSRDEAIAAIDDMLGRGCFGQAGAKILVEEMLEGEEVSLLALCDGDYAAPLPSAQDHKAAYDGDKGPNTGGMGAYSPAPLLPDCDLEKMTDLVIRPVLRALKAEGHPFRGVLYAGLMLTQNGPKVLEYNVRFGDPECEPLMLRLESDLVRHMLACCEGKLPEEQISFRSESAVGIVLAAKGYPGEYARNLPVSGLEKASQTAKVFHGGTVKENGAVKSTGGRVLCVTAIGKNLKDAKQNAYAAVEQICMPQCHYRTDIAEKGITRLNQQHAG